MTSLVTRGGMTALVAVAFMTLAPLSSPAAVRVCKAPVASGLAREPSEPAAKQRAIQDWTVRAKAAGVANPAWRTADKKLLKCAPSAAGAFECVAYAAPCTVQQVAPKRGPRGKGPFIEV
jgi:hypothetical protein